MVSAIMKKHLVTAETLGAFVDGELSAQETARVKEHLARCEECRDEVALLCRVSGLVRSARVSEDVKIRLAGFSDRIEAEVRRAGSKGTIWSRLADRWLGAGSLRRWSPAYSLAVAVVAVIVIGVSLDLTRGWMMPNAVAPSREVAYDLEVETGIKDANITILSGEDAIVVWVEGAEGA
jgi:anti-sigma factor RsiW